MRYIKLTLILFSLSFLVYPITSCSATDKNIKTVNKEYTRIEGLVERIGDDIFITVNPDCKCRKSYKVIGDKKEELKKVIGMFVEVEGYVKSFTPWSGEIEVKKIFLLER